jgi:hypothetical protein
MQAAVHVPLTPRHPPECYPGCGISSCGGPAISQTASSPGSTGFGSDLLPGWLRKAGTTGFQLDAVQKRSSRIPRCRSNRSLKARPGPASCPRTVGNTAGCCGSAAMRDSTPCLARSRAKPSLPRRRRSKPWTEMMAAPRSAARPRSGPCGPAHRPAQGGLGRTGSVWDTSRPKCGRSGVR